MWPGSCAPRARCWWRRPHLKRRGTPGHPSELADHDCLPYLRPGPAVWPFEQKLAKGRAAGAKPAPEPERVRVTVSGSLRANNSEVLRDAVMAGLGIALLPDFSAAAALRAARLRELLPKWRPIGFFGEGIYALRPWSPQVPRAVRTLVEHLRRGFGEGFGA